MLEAFQENLRRTNRRPCVLLLEDDGNDVTLAALKLKEHQISVMVAASVRQAIELLDITPFDVVFLDLRLPQGSGLEVLSYAQHAGLQTIFIVLTGVDDSDPMIQESLTRGATSVILKPLTDEHIKLIFGAIP